MRTLPHSKKYLYVKTPPGQAPQNEKHRKTLKFQFTFFSVVVESVHAVCIAECAPKNLKINQTYACVNNSFVLAGIQCRSCSLLLQVFGLHALHSFLDLLSQDLDSVENSTIRLCSEN